MKTYETAIIVRGRAGAEFAYLDGPFIRVVHKYVETNGEFCAEGCGYLRKEWCDIYGPIVDCNRSNECKLTFREAF